MKRLILPIVFLFICNLSIAQICNKSQLPFNLQNGLVGYYPFCGNANDGSGNGNNGVVAGATLTTDRFGNANSAYNFNGSSVISVANNASLNIQQRQLTLSQNIFQYNQKSLMNSCYPKKRKLIKSEKRTLQNLK